LDGGSQLLLHVHSNTPSAPLLMALYRYFAARSSTDGPVFGSSPGTDGLADVRSSPLALGLALDWPLALSWSSSPSPRELRTESMASRASRNAVSFLLESDRPAFSSAWLADFTVSTS